MGPKIKYFYKYYEVSGARKFPTLNFHLVIWNDYAASPNF